MTDIKSFITPYRAKIDTAIVEALKEEGTLPIYSMLRYFMGYEDKSGKQLETAKGKRIRSILLLVVADMFGGAKSAEDLAIAVELFHNFTLIHDDIEDNDELRRGRPTVWKLWGIDHGINSGDAQAFLTTKHLLRAAAIDPVAGGAATEELNKYFIDVIEGQYLDFELTKKALDDPEVTEVAYLEMIRKKTSVLIGTAVAAGGVAAGCNKEVRDLLFQYGENLGMAYQMADDVSSLWGDVSETGKRAYGDVIERKKTYPILYARDNGASKKLVDLYTQDSQLESDDAKQVVEELTRLGAREATHNHGEKYVTRAKESVERLPITADNKAVLLGFVDAFIHFAPEQHASD